MPRIAVAVVLVGFALLACPAAAQPNSNIQAMLSKPELQPFVAKFISIPECLSDRNLMYFDIDQCGSLLAMLDALSLGNKNPAVSCELSCTKQFAKLNDTCLLKVRSVFGNDTDSDVGRLGAEFFAACDETVKAEEEALAPSPAPADMVPPNAEVTSAPPPLPESPVAQPSTPPPPPTSAASALSKAALSLLSVVAAAFYLMA